VREVERLEREAWSTWRLSCREREEAGGKKKKKKITLGWKFSIYT
jgi:hypothetical protein